MEISIFQVDAFADQIFSGNPAAVCPLESWLSDSILQSIAAENNLAETAFFVRQNGKIELRWFTPACEVDLCGHATLASAHVLIHCLGATDDTLRFQTKSGELLVHRSGERLELDFPSRPPATTEIHSNLRAAFNIQPQDILAARDYLLRYQSEDEVKALKPDMMKLLTIDRFAVIVTAPGRTCDFVSRFFAPAKGIPEDPVTGSAHCTLIPYWAGQLGKQEFHARQLSPRGGELFCKLVGERVRMAGNAVLFLKGSIFV